VEKEKVNRLRDNYLRVCEQVAEAALRSGRAPGEVRVVAVSKTVPAPVLQNAFAIGIKEFGENRVQEALPKIESLGEGPTWHMVGHLQRNKVRLATAHFHLIHSLDSLRLANALQKEGERQGKEIPVLVQVNVSGEESKFGISPVDLPSFLEQVRLLNKIKVKGLMTIAPLVEKPESARTFFRRLKDLSEKNSSKAHPLTELSMGMSGDFTVAIEEGATIVRIGRAIFGER